MYATIEDQWLITKKIKLRIINVAIPIGSSHHRCSGPNNEISPYKNEVATISTDVTDFDNEHKFTSAS